MESGVVGDPADPNTEVGPIVNEKQLEEILAGIERGKSEGGTVLTGGERIDDEAYLVAPTLFEGVGDDAFLSCEEVFGPVTSLYRFTELDEALERANAVEFGLSAAIFTSSLASAQRLRGADRGRDHPRQLARRPAPTSTCRSAGSRARASARTSRAAPRGSSTPRSVTVYQDV